MGRILLLVLVGVCVLPGPAQAWTWPTRGAVLRPFSFDRSHPYAGGQHRGTDVAGASGSDVLAAAGGTVSFAGSVPTSGRVVTVETPDGYSVTFTHLGAIAVRKGASIREGDAVGSVGPSGDVELDEPYVHLG